MCKFCKSVNLAMDGIKNQSRTETAKRDFVQSRFSHIYIYIYAVFFLGAFTITGYITFTSQVYRIRIEQQPTKPSYVSNKK